MPTNAERVLAYLAEQNNAPDDDQIAEALHIDRIQVNQICRRLAAAGVIERGKPPDGGKIVNRSGVSSGSEEGTVLLGDGPKTTDAAAQVRIMASVEWLTDKYAVHLFAYEGTSGITEDQVKAAVQQLLAANGWHSDVAYGHSHGVDIDAVRGAQRFVLEAKGEGKHDPERGNYFDGALGELMRRMDAPGMHYGLALPAHRRFVRLVERLPLWVRQRLGLWFFFVHPTQEGLRIGVYPPDASPEQAHAVLLGHEAST
jgi:hypothetical protein